MTNARIEIPDLAPEMIRPVYRPAAEPFRSLPQVTVPAQVAGRLSAMATFSPGDIA